MFHGANIRVVLNNKLWTHVELTYEAATSAQSLFEPLAERQALEQAFGQSGNRC